MRSLKCTRTYVECTDVEQVLAILDDASAVVAERLEQTV